MSYTSQRHAIILALQARLAAITIAGGYNTDAGLALYVGEVPDLGPDDAATAIAVVLNDDDTGHQGEHVVCTIPIEVHGLVKHAAATPALSAEPLISDIKRAVEKADRTLGGVLPPRGLTRGSTRALKREPGSQYVGAVVEYEVMVAEEWGAP